MEQRLKQRLVGAAVLVVAGVIFLPMLLDDSPDKIPLRKNAGIPEKPETKFSSRIQPLDASALDESEINKVFVDVQDVAKESESQAGSDGSGDVEAGSKNTKDTPAEVKAGITAWVVQLGSFGSEKNARALEKKLRDKKYTAFVETQYTDNGKQFRVRVGPEVMSANAKKLKAKLDKEFNMKTIVVRYP